MLTVCVRIGEVCTSAHSRWPLAQTCLASQACASSGLGCCGTAGCRTTSTKASACCDTGGATCLFASMLGRRLCCPTKQQCGKVRSCRLFAPVHLPHHSVHRIAANIGIKLISSGNVEGTATLKRLHAFDAFPAFWQRLVQHANPFKASISSIQLCSAR